MCVACVCVCAAAAYRASDVAGLSVCLHVFAYRMVVVSTMQLMLQLLMPIHAAQHEILLKGVVQLVVTGRCMKTQHLCTTIASEAADMRCVFSSTSTPGVGNACTAHVMMRPPPNTTHT